MITNQIKEVLYSLNNQNWIKDLHRYSNIYIVGGSVRDGFLNKKIKDIDIVVEGLLLDRISDILSFYGNVDVVGESFSVIKFKPFNYNGEPYDISVPRKDKKIAEGHKGFEIINENVTIFEDLLRRDITINSIAINIKTSEIIDPLNGLIDLSNALIKATDLNVFIDDPLRLMRVIQFAARFNFEIEDATKNLMKNNSHLLTQIASERILEEFEKIYNKNGNFTSMLKLLNETDLDVALFGKKINIDYITMVLYESLNYDELSFYYILARCGNVIPSQFYSLKLKGKAKITNGLKVLENIVESKWNKYNVFLSLKESPLIKDCVILPSFFKKTIKDMQNGIIPMKLGDVNITGNDIINFDNSIEGPKIGKIMKQIYIDALDNKFNWKDRISTLNYLKNIMNERTINSKS